MPQVGIRCPVGFDRLTVEIKAEGINGGVEGSVERCVMVSR